MTLKQKFQKIFYPPKITDKGLQLLEDVSDEFAIDFAEWMPKYKFLPNKGWYLTSYEIEMNLFKTSKELLEIYKKENNL